MICTDAAMCVCVCVEIRSFDGAPILYNSFISHHHFSIPESGEG